MGVAISKALAVHDTLMNEHESISIHSRLWTPSIPKHEKIKVTNLLPGRDEGTFEPRENIDFGGDNGVLLESLSRLVMHMLWDECSISRMEFHYSNGDVKAFGTGPFGTELSFCVDGPGGERITKIGIFRNQVENTLAGIEVRVLRLISALNLLTSTGGNESWSNGRICKSSATNRDPECAISTGLLEPCPDWACCLN